MDIWENHDFISWINAREMLSSSKSKLYSQNTKGVILLMMIFNYFRVSLIINIFSLMIYIAIARSHKKIRYDIENPI